MATDKNGATTVSNVRLHSRNLVRELDVIKNDCLDTGYTFSQCHILFELSTHTQLSLMGLSQNLLLDKSNTSRTVKKLIELGLVKSVKDAKDNRQKFFSLTVKGKKALSKTNDLANHQVSNALENLSVEQQEKVVEGLRLYSSALRKSRLQSEFEIRPIQKRDNVQVAKIIRDVLEEFGAVGEGYSIVDTEIDDMHGNYANELSCFYVIESEGQIFGTGGIAPLVGGSKNDV